MKNLKKIKYFLLLLSILVLLPLNTGFAQQLESGAPCGPDESQFPSGLGGYTCIKTGCPEGQVKREGQCVIENTNTYNGESSSSNYVLLAPISTTGEDVLSTFNPEETNALGRYLNIMIKIVIGLAAVMAVVMIVVGGMEYMTSELISSKEAGKQRITEAVLGLLLALGAYAILYTINPNLLRTDTINNLADAEVTVNLEDPIFSDSGTPPGPTTQCSSGVVKTNINMFACSDIVQNINNMLTAAKNAGLNITGGGYRTEAAQRQLRIANCKGNTTDRSAPCTPPTALPGLSNHNNGKAFDLRCDGVSIQTRDNKCFLWLKENASRYGLSNLASEPWHWSVDGR